MLVLYGKDVHTSQSRPPRPCLWLVRIVDRVVYGVLTDIVVKADQFPGEFCQQLAW
jgi:hypothetical protein